MQGFSRRWGCNFPKYIPVYHTAVSFSNFFARFPAFSTYTISCVEKEKSREWRADFEEEQGKSGKPPQKNLFSPG
ncbi:hypothetical protein D1841_09615 [Neglecta sp. X4]|nr:hypothetical protein [Neglectibacter sp. 59]NBJ73547.1 hypothetical protein [Neglectibacter sp. X4]NCE81248.1 hypothetical protein [Neglectibacter sp. X58]